MVGESLHPLAAAAWGLAGQQHGVVARRQLLAIGWIRRAIEHRLATGRLHQLWRGIYVVGRPQSAAAVNGWPRVLA